MSNFLIAIAIYFVLPFGVGALAVSLRALVDGLAWLIHGPDAASPAAPPSDAWMERYMPIQLRHLSWQAPAARAAHREVPGRSTPRPSSMRR